MDFVGCKLLLVTGDQLLTYLRDDKPGLPFAARWDLPGGGREGDETPEACVLRELEEEFGLILPEERLLRRWDYPSMTDETRPSWFFAGVIHQEEINTIRFGDEGQYWQMMANSGFLGHPKAVPELQRWTSIALDDLTWR